MKQFNFLKKPFFTAVVISFSILSACKKDSDNLIKPEIADAAAEVQDTIITGSSTLLHPKLKIHDNLIYSWTVNGKEEGTDSTYTFNPIARGDYQVEFKAINSAGETTKTYRIHVRGKYENGFYIVNEGWFGRGTGTVSFYRYDTNQLEDSVFVKENPDKNLEPASATLDFGTIYKEKLYLVTKAGGPVVVADAYSMKELKRIPAQGGNDWRAFVGIDDTRGLLSSQKGLYVVDLNSLEVGTQISGISGQVGDMIKAGNYIFVLSQTQGLVILSASTYAVIKKIAGMQVGFARTKDGAVWVAGGTKLNRIDPATLEVTPIDVPFTVYGSWGAWHPGSITASSNDNTVYLAKNGSWSGGKEIYRYNGTATSLQSPFITLPEGRALYGAGLGFDARLDRVVVTTVKSGYNFNDLYFYDPQTGAEKKNISYTGYYFPAVPVFH